MQAALRHHDGVPLLLVQRHQLLVGPQGKLGGVWCRLRLAVERLHVDARVRPRLVEVDEIHDRDLYIPQRPRVVRDDGK